MENDNDILYNPHSVRLKDYDYSQPGAYFVTICAYARHCFFGEVRNIEVVLNEFGTIVESCWNEIPEHFPLVNTDYLVVMPNHLHGIVIIYEGNRKWDFLRHGMPCLYIIMIPSILEQKHSESLFPRHYPP
jgi:hypothetical protein